MEQLLLVVALIATQQDGEATKKAAEAYAKQSGLDEQLQRLQRKYVPQRVSDAAVVAQVLIERKIVLTWSFK